MDVFQIFHDLVSENMISQKSAAKILNMRESKLKKIWKENKYKPIKTGRPIKVLNEKLIKEVLEYRKKFNVGYKRCTQVMKRKGFEATYYEIFTIFEMEGLFTYDIEYKDDKKNFKNYYAKYEHQIWHTDLHEYI